MRTKYLLLILIIFMSSIVFGDNEINDKDKQYLENIFKKLKKQCCLIVAQDSVEYMEVYASHFGFDKLKYKKKIRDFCKEMLEEELLHKIIVEVCEIDEEYNVVRCISILELKFEDNKNEIKKRYLQEKKLPNHSLDTDQLQEVLRNNVTVDKNKKYRLKKYYIFDPLYETHERFQKQKINRKNLLMLGDEKKIEYAGWKTLQKIYANKHIIVKILQ